MQKVGIFFGSNSGNTEEVASQLKDLLVEAEVHDVSNSTIKDLAPYSNIIFGSSTWGSGDLQDDFEKFAESLGQVDFTGKKVAIFGLGDSASYGDSFANSIAHIYNKIKDKAEIIGAVPADGYSFSESESVSDGNFLGLALDIDNESDKTDERLENWVEILKSNFA
jgi:flavodoxin I